MALMQWNERWAVGVQMIDDDHKHLVKLINELHDSLAAGKSRDVIGPTLKALVQYTKTHFGREQAEMAKYSYPKMGEHVKAHTDFVSKVVDVQARLKKGSDAVTMEVMLFLRDWLLQHISNVDRSLADFLREAKMLKSA